MLQAGEHQMFCIILCFESTDLKLMKFYCTYRAFHDLWTILQEVIS